MKKIAIVGPSGAGKTTLAKNLSSSLNMKAFHLDRLFWYSDWKKETRDNRIDILEKLIQEKQWIIEGTYINSTQLHLIAADTIIFLDTLPLACLLRIIKRYRKYRGYSRRRDIPEGCTEKLTILRILKVLFFPLQGRIKLEINLHKFSREKIIRLHSASEVKVFLVNPELYVLKYRQSIKKRSVLAVLRQVFIKIFDCILQGLITSFPYTGYSSMEVLDICEQNLDINHPHVASAYNRNPL